MSGPKYSTAYIRELNRLKQLAKELEEKVEKSKCEQLISDIRTLEKKKDEYCEKANIVSYSEFIKKAELLIPNSISLKEMKRLLSDIESTKSSIYSISGNSKDLLTKYNEYQNELKRLKNTISLLGELKKQITVEGSVAKQEQKYEDFLNVEWEDSEEQIDVIPLDLQELYYKLLSKISECDDYEKQKQLIDETIMKAGDNLYKKNQIELRMSAIDVEKNSSNNNIELLGLLCELRGLYSLLGWEEKELPVTVDDAKEKVRVAQETLQRDQTAAYISECIHRVFQEKGYMLLDDSIVSTSNAKIKKNYYDFGEDSMIDVSMSNKGQILFEVVGQGTDKAMDEKRSQQLESEMRRFCPNYAEVKESLLKDYGISLEDEHLCEPDKKYAKAVDIKANKNDRRAKIESKKKYLDN